MMIGGIDEQFAFGEPLNMYEIKKLMTSSQGFKLALVFALVSGPNLLSRLQVERFQTQQLIQKPPSCGLGVT